MITQTVEPVNLGMSNTLWLQTASSYEQQFANRKEPQIVQKVFISCLLFSPMPYLMNILLLASTFLRLAHWYCLQSPEPESPWKGSYGAVFCMFLGPLG